MKISAINNQNFMGKEAGVKILGELVKEMLAENR